MSLIFSQVVTIADYSSRYLQEIGYTDTIIDVRSNRVRSWLGIHDNLDDENEENASAGNLVAADRNIVTGGVRTTVNGEAGTSPQGARPRAAISASAVGAGTAGSVQNDGNISRNSLAEDIARETEAVMANLDKFLNDSSNFKDDDDMMGDDSDLKIGPSPSALGQSQENNKFASQLEP